MNTARRILTATVTAVALSMSFNAAPASADGGPHIVVLGTLTGTCCSQALAINDHGVVVGQSQAGTGENPPERAFRWQNGTMTDLGTLGGPRAVATAINNNGWIVGYSTLADGVTTHGFLWRPGIGMTDLGSLGASSLATGVNDNGVVVGRYVLNGVPRGFRWANGVLSDLGTPSGAGFEAAGVNKHGKIAGTLFNGATGLPATWKNGTMQLSGLFGDASAINDNGDVSGTDWRDVGPFVWRANGTVLPLTLPAGSVYATTTGINESRHTVGYRTAPSGATRAVCWSKFGTPRLLPSLVPGGQSMAWGVNRLGQTVGQANLGTSGGEYTAVLWTR